MTEKEFEAMLEEINNNYFPDYEITCSNYVGVKEENDPNKFHVIVKRCIFPKERVGMLYIDIAEKKSDETKNEIISWIDELTTGLEFC